MEMILLLNCNLCLSSFDVTSLSDSEKVFKISENLLGVSKLI